MQTELCWANTGKCIFQMTLSFTKSFTLLLAIWGFRCGIPDMHALEWASVGISGTQKPLGSLLYAGRKFSSFLQQSAGILPKNLVMDNANVQRGKLFSVGTL